MKRSLKLILLLFIFSAIEIANYLGFLIDELFYASYRRISIKAPVFIVGMPRSGTTFLHKLLASDTGRFTTMRLWEIVLAPSIFQKRIALVMSKIANNRMAFLMKPLRQFDKWIFRQYDPIHPLSLFSIEEDDYLFFHIFTSSHLLFWFPSIKWLYQNIRFDDKIDERTKSLQLRYYRNCIKKHLYVFGKGRTYLAKSPMHTPRIESLRRIFPDIVTINLVRAPHKVIPSTISLFRMFACIFHTPVSIDTLQRWALDIADHWYATALDQSKNIPNDKFITILFSALTKDPIHAIECIYSRLHYSLSSEFWKRLKTASLESKTYQSRHSYSLKRFHLEEQEIRKRYRNVYYAYFPNENKPAKDVPVSLVTHGQSGWLG